MARLHVVVGGQFGSEAKGHFTGKLTERLSGPLLVIRVAGPNAGHTIVSEAGTRYAFRQIPVAAVSRPDAQLFIAPGSEVDTEVLLDEIDLLEADGIKVRNRLWVSGQATVLTAEHRAREGGNDSPIQQRIGSTGKGVGAARADRIMRVANTVADYQPYLDANGVRVGFPPAWDNSDAEVVIEGTQGHGLGLHAGYYPYCTSSDCRALDFIAMSGVLPADFHTVHTYVVYRTYPIRVAGNSGPLYNETSWEALGLQSGGYIQPERTTVTKKIRRVGLWDPYLAARAFRDNRVTYSGRVLPVLMFGDYIEPALAGSCDRHTVYGTLDAYLKSIMPAWADLQPDMYPIYIGTGPNTGAWSSSLPI